jgi:predicted  nucleic acid-binding Zn-ribbon protein
MSSAKVKKHGHWKGLIVALFCLVLAGVLFWNRQYVVDQVNVWQYQPSTEMSAIVERSGIDGTGEFYFYASHPSLLDAAAFNETCERKEETTAILGCYNGQYIYVYNVTDAKLDGVREVTAAHEMLHAAYARLSDDEKQRIQRLIDAEYEKLKSDADLAERLAFYDRTEPGERYNELHSIIGTEVASVSSELENHYAKYFGDRGKTVRLYNQYSEVFKELEQRGESLSQQLDQLADQIEGESAAYNTDVSQFDRDVESFNRRAENGEFSSQAAFDSERAQLVARGDALEARRRAINDKVSQYEELRAELAGIATQSEALNRSIDSNLAPAPSL